MTRETAVAASARPSPQPRKARPGTWQPARGVQDENRVRVPWRPASAHHSRERTAVRTGGKGARTTGRAPGVGSKGQDLPGHLPPRHERSVQAPSVCGATAGVLCRQCPGPSSSTGRTAPSHLKMLLILAHDEHPLPASLSWNSAQHRSTRPQETEPSGSAKVS